MGYCDIFYANEGRYLSVNENHFKKFFDCFTKETGIDVCNLAISSGVSKDSYAEMFFYIRHIILMKYPKYVKYFFELLDVSGYDMSMEIIYAIRSIGKNATYSLDEDVIRYVLLSPYINAVTNDHGKITICSEEFGDYSFITTRKYLYENKKALYLIQNYITQGYCHIMSWELMKYLENVSLVTSLMPSYFEGTYYHSVIRDQNDLFIDAANEAVFDNDTRDYLFKMQDVVETKKEDLHSRLIEAKIVADEKSEDFGFNPALLLTLHKEYQNLNKR